MKTVILAAAALLALATAQSLAAQSTLSGTLVNVASYVTGNGSAVSYGMGAMMGSAGYGSMHGGSGGYGTMMGGTGYAYMRNCAGSLGLVTSAGTLYLLVVQPSGGAVTGGYALCSRIGSRVTIRGATFERGGMHALEVESVQ